MSKTYKTQTLTLGRTEYMAEIHAMGDHTALLVLNRYKSEYWCPIAPGGASIEADGSVVYTVAKSHQKKYEEAIKALANTIEEVRHAL